jgi:hypothetical protein
MKKTIQTLVSTKQLIANAKRLTDADIANIRAKGLIVVHRPDAMLASTYNSLRMQICASAEAGA